MMTLNIPVDKNLQELELDMLIHFDNVCKMMGIYYFLVGGTLLGAIRHKGFIPWDDDIDVGMKRSDYEYFISHAKELLPEYIFLQNYKTDKNVPFCFTKLRNINTTFIETSVKNIDMNHGVYIDIFPFDFYPSNIFDCWSLECSEKLLSHKIDKAYYIEGDTKSSFFGRVADRLSNIIFYDIQSAVKYRDKMYKSVRKSLLMTNYCGAWGKKEIVPKEWLDGITEVEFEGKLFFAPKEYDKYLKHIYGDYMKLPPENKRITHHYTECIDLNKPYTFYMKGE